MCVFFLLLCLFFFLTLTVGGVRGSLRCCCRGLPWLKSINPFGSVVLKSNEIDPAFFAVHLLSATKDSGVSKVTGSSVATLSHLNDTTPLTWEKKIVKELKMGCSPNETSVMTPKLFFWIQDRNKDTKKKALLPALDWLHDKCSWLPLQKNNPNYLKLYTTSLPGPDGR